jgi:hypothetical protein
LNVIADPNDRFARALLRLYPRAWRERYGDEFLALIADAGLTWREIVDVIGAASVERVRAVITLVRSELDPTDPPVVATDGPTMDDFREGALYFALALLTVLASSIVGVTLPRWTLWPYLLFQLNRPRLQAARAHANWRERAWLSYCWFLGVVGVTGLCWFVMRLLISAGMPQLSDRAFVTLVGPIVIAALIRGVYCSIRIGIYASTWRGMHPRELLAWRLVILAAAVMVANVDPAGEVFWPVAMFAGFAFRIPYEFTRRGAERRRAQFEESERFWSK